MITAKEKAKNIGKVNARQYRHNYRAKEFVFSNEECETSALEMSEWIKHYLETRRDEYIASINTKKDMYDYGYVDAINECIDELFGEEESDCSENDE